MTTEAKPQSNQAMPDAVMAILRRVERAVGFALHDCEDTDTPRDILRGLLSAIQDECAVVESEAELYLTPRKP